MATNRSIAVLLVSCDRYSDLWEPYYALFRRFWPHCPYPVYHVSNHKPAAFPGVTPITVGEDRTWSANVRKALQAVPADYILMLLDDLFITATVDQTRVTGLMDWMSKNQAHCIRLNPLPAPDKRIAGNMGKTLGESSPGTLYRASTMFSVWKKQTLFDLLDERESAWEFETNATIRSDRLPGFFAAYKPTFCFVNGVIKGKWERKALRRLQKLGAPIAEGRPVMSLKDEIVFGLHRIRSEALKIVPARYRRAVKRLARSKDFTYSIKT